MPDTNSTRFIVVPTSDAYAYWVKHLSPHTPEYAHEHEEEMLPYFDRWMTWLCGELLDGTDIQYMFHHTSRVARHLLHFKVPYRVITKNGTEREAHLALEEYIA